MAETKKEDLRGTGNLTKLMLNYSLPCVISLLVGALYNIVDQIFIANADYLGSYGNAANSVIYPLTVICLAIAVTFGDGEGSFLSISLGAGDRKNAGRSVGCVASSVLIVSLFITAVYAVFQNPIIGAFGGRVNESTFRMAKGYFTWIIVGIPFYMFGQAFCAVISADGSPRYTLFATITGCVINIILDPIFIYVFRMGMEGAAIATIIGQIAVAVICLLYLPRMKSVKLDRDCFKVRKPLLKKIIPLGMNSFFAQASIVLSMAAVNNMARKYAALTPVFSNEELRQIPTAVIGIVMKFFQIVISIAIGISAGSLPIVGYNVGAKKNDRVLGILKRLVVAEVCVGLVACLIFELFPHQLIGIFGAANESEHYTLFALAAIRIFLSMIMLSCLNKGIMIFMQAMGKAGYAITISVLREIVLGVGLPLTLPLFFGLDGLLYFMPLADIITAVVVFILLRKVYISLKAAPSVERKTETAEAVMKSTAPALTDFIITIGRSYGGGGRSVGKKLAEDLLIPYYDGDLLDKVAHESGLDRSFIESLDEKPIKPVSLFGYGHALALAYPAAMSKESEEEALRAQVGVIEKIASEGPCVIVGRRADQILSSSRTFRVFLTASEEQRIRRVMSREGLDEKESAKKILSVDRERAAYYNQFGEKKWGDPASYDLCIDIDRFGIDGSAKLIEMIVKKAV